ncbi:MAG: tryptophan--tRNA ligase [archaeon]
MAYKVTPWEVSGDVDYEKLIKDFGTSKLGDPILKRLEKHTGELHPFLKRGLFFSHRDFDWILDKYEKGEKFYLYTGRGPSGDTHIAHLIPWMFTKWLQDKLDVELYFQITDDEKFLVKPITLDQTLKFSYDNALDLIALGFDPKKTFAFIDTEYAKTLYKIALEVAKRTTFSTAKAVFGFTNESNIGIIFFPAMQAAPCFLPSVLKGKNIPCLIPAAIDQDPYWRISRDVAPKLGYYKTAAIHSKFLSGLSKGGKMSASDKSSAIYTKDKPEEVEFKIKRALTGGRDTVAEQKEKGGQPEKCVVYEYQYYLFELDDKAVNERARQCKSGELMCGECKQNLIKSINKFLAKHQAEREKAKSKVEKFMLRD